MFPLPFLFLLLSFPYFLSSYVFAQNLTPSSSWRKPNITTPIDQRISIADDAIQEGIQNLNVNDLFPDSSFGTPGAFFAQMAEFDIATNQTKYKDQLRNFFSTVIIQRPGFGDQFLNYALVYGYAAIRAYQAYNDSVFLGYAQTVWEFGQAFTLTQDQAKAGSTDVKSFPISSQCQGITMAGGGFWQDTLDEPSLNALSTGYFLLLSALLGQATSNQTYIDAATLSANFIHAHLYNINNVVLDSISARQNDSCSSSSLAGPYNCGLMIEGLAVLSSVTKNPDMRSLMLAAIGAAVTQKLFQGPDGIISTGGGHAGDLNLVRGLVAAYNSNKTDSNAREFLRQYIGVQYNAVLDQATVSGSNIYGASWVGPPATTFGSDNHTTSLAPLIGAIYLQNDPPPNNSSNSGSGGGNGGGNGGGGGGKGGSKSLAGPIAGGVIGGLVLIALAVAAFFFLSRRKNQRKREFFIDEYDGTRAPLPVPFMAQAPATNPIATGAETTESYDPYATSRTSQSGTTSSGAVIPFGTIRREKQGPPLAVPSSHTRSDSSSMSVSTANQSGSGVSPRPADGIPTSELVRLLNERLQPEHWNAEDAPPEYQHPTR